MSKYNLEKYTMTELKDMAQEMDIKPRRNKKDMIADISAAFKEYERYYTTKVKKYTKIKQIGKGDQGTTYIVEDNKKKKYAMKTFRKSKSSRTLEQEYNLQKIAGNAKIAPKVYSYDTISKYILMDVMDCHLIDLIAKQKGVLRKYQQKRILEIFRTLDEIKIFHGDVNPANYMLKGKTIYLIDYGLAKPIDKKLEKRLKTNTPNMTLMLIGFILKLKEANCTPSSYKYLMAHVSEKNRLKYKL